MKKIFLLSAIFFVFSFSFSQSSVSRSHTGGLKKNSEKDFERIKSTITVFVLPDCIEITDYEKILADVWDVTDYIVVSSEEFHISDFIDKDYSFVTFKVFTQTSTLTRNSGRNSAKTNITYYLDFSVLNTVDFKKEYIKLTKRKKPKNSSKIKKSFMKNSKMFASITLYPKIITSEFGGLINFCQAFHNSNTGFLKNYFQKINDLISKNENYWLYENDYKKELALLSKEVLYIPSYFKIKYDRDKYGNLFSKNDEKINKEYIDDLLSNYNYKFTFISDEDLNQKILDNEELYYLTYVMSNKQKFMQIVNSKTGEVIYRDYIADVVSSKNVKGRHINIINKIIEKALRE